MAATTQDIAPDLAPTGVLRASINLGNPVLAQGTAADPSGVTVDLACEIGRRLDLPVELSCFAAARRSFEAMVAGDADICFLAIEPAREAEVAFTPPYVVIEGVFAVPEGSPVQAPADVDVPGVRIGVKRGSAYDLYLTRTLQHAEMVRGEEGTTWTPLDRLPRAIRVVHPRALFVTPVGDRLPLFVVRNNDRPIPRRSLDRLPVTHRCLPPRAPRAGRTGRMYTQRSLL